MVKAVRPERDALEIRFPRVSGYRVELPEERLTAEFNADSVLELTPDIVGPSITKNEGIIGEEVELTLEHLGDMRRSTLLYHLVKRLIYTKWRDAGEDPKLFLFGELKRIAKQWLDTCLVCEGGTYPAQLMYQELADIACERTVKENKRVPDPHMRLHLISPDAKCGACGANNLTFIRVRKFGDLYQCSSGTCKRQVLHYGVP